MKKNLLILLSLFIVSCKSSTPSTHNPSTEPPSSAYPSTEIPGVSLPNDEPSHTPNSSTQAPSVSNNSTQSQTSSKPTQVQAISDVLNLGKDLTEGNIGEQVTFTGVYVKMINFNFDHYMLFVDDNDYIYVYVNNNDYSKLNNKYLKYSYTVSGTIKKERGNVIVNYESIANLSTSEVKINYDTLATRMNSIAEINEEASKIVLDEKKYNGSGKIISFDAQIIAFDESDANQKIVAYDGINVITVIDTKKIGSTPSDIGSTYTFIGAINVQSSHPAILLIDKSLKDADNQEIVINNDEEVTVSYFSKWNLNSSVMKVPTFEDYAKIYTSTVYVKYDESKTNAYYLGIVDNITDSLSDSGMTSKNVVKGAYLMNNLNKTEREVINYSPFYEYLVEEIPVTFSYVLFNFNNNDHIWRVMPLDFTIPEYQGL